MHPELIQGLRHVESITHLLSRPVLIDICKDGTISYRRRGKHPFNKVALPVFSVNDERQAEELQVRFGRCQYEEHPMIPGKRWYRWTDFSGSVFDLPKITDACILWWEQMGYKEEA